MAQAQIAQGYTFKHGGNRVGSYASVTNGKHDISVTIKAWLDDNLEPTTRAKATYIKMHRWSYGSDGVPATFAVRRA